VRPVIRLRVSAGVPSQQPDDNEHNLSISNVVSRNWVPSRLGLTNLRRACRFIVPSRSQHHPGSVAGLLGDGNGPLSTHQISVEQVVRSEISAKRSLLQPLETHRLEASRAYPAGRCVRQCSKSPCRISTGSYGFPHASCPCSCTPTELDGIVPTAERK
jgi:hypothetical protein